MLRTAGNRPSSHSERIYQATQSAFEKGAGPNAWKRTRYRGRGRRGRTPAPVDDSLDVRLALTELGGVLSMLDAAARAADGERRGIHATALGKLELVRRLVDEVLARRSKLLARLPNRPDWSRR